MDSFRSPTPDEFADFFMMLDSQSRSAVYPMGNADEDGFHPHYTGLTRHEA